MMEKLVMERKNPPRCPEKKKYFDVQIQSYVYLRTLKLVCRKNPDGEIRERAKILRGAISHRGKKEFVASLTRQWRRVCKKGTRIAPRIRRFSYIGTGKDKHARACARERTYEREARTH